MTLGLDPFTCAAPAGTGQPWTCLHLDEPSACETNAQLEQPGGAVYEADIQVTALLGSEVQVTGTDQATGRTFSCTGVVSFSIDEALLWSCEACDGDACQACSVPQTSLCQL
jgi:hypothetical protein